MAMSVISSDFRGGLCNLLVYNLNIKRMFKRRKKRK